MQFCCNRISDRLPGRLRETAPGIVNQRVTRCRLCFTMTKQLAQHGQRSGFVDGAANVCWR